MDLTRYVEGLRRELEVIAAASGEEAQALIDRLSAPLESAIRLTLLNALSSAADEITTELAPGSVHLRLRGQDPDFVVSAAPGQAEAVPEAAIEPEESVPAGEKGATSRINLRLPDDLKVRIDEAADRERISVNSWLVRAAAAALTPVRGGIHRATGGERFTGWVS